MPFAPALGLLVCVGIGGPASAQNTTYDRFNSGNWNGGASKRDSTGRFEYCFISTGYTDGATITFGIFGNRKLGLVVGKKSWKLTKDQRYKVRVTVDRRNIGSFNTRNTSANNFLVDFGDRSSAALYRLRRGKVLRLRTPGRELSYTLSGTNKALTRTEQCVARNTGGGASAGTSGSGSNNADGGGASGQSRDERPTSTEPPPKVPEDVRSNRASKKKM